MGYSISIQVRNKKLGQKMVAFLREHGRNFGYLAGHEKDSEMFGPYWADGTGDAISRERGGLSYVHRKGHLGFDYGTHREYAYVVLKWMAQKIGAKRGGKFCYLYDGHEWVEIEDTNTLGMPTDKAIAESPLLKYEWNLQYKKGGPKAYDIVKDEMKRLDDIWEEINGK